MVSPEEPKVLDLIVPNMAAHQAVNITHSALHTSNHSFPHDTLGKSEHFAENYGDNLAGLPENASKEVPFDNSEVYSPSFSDRNENVPFHHTEVKETSHPIDMSDEISDHVVEDIQNPLNNAPSPHISSAQSPHISSAPSPHIPRENTENSQISADSSPISGNIHNVHSFSSNDEHNVPITSSNNHNEPNPLHQTHNAPIPDHIIDELPTNDQVALDIYENEESYMKEEDIMDKEDVMAFQDTVHSYDVKQCFFFQFWHGWSNRASWDGSI